MATLDKSLLLEMFRKMEEIRRMDLKIAQLVKKGKVPGMTHFSVGEEAANVGAMLALNEDDLITSNHRGHGQAIAKGIDLNGMMAEILGKYTGTCKGKGGSMHIADLDAGNLGANGIVGGGMGIAVGAALSQQMKHTGKIVVCFFGDGAHLPAVSLCARRNHADYADRSGNAGCQQHSYLRADVRSGLPTGGVVCMPVHHPVRGDAAAGHASGRAISLLKFQI